MSAPIVQTTYQQLDQAARGFDQAHQHMRQVGTQLAQKVGTLRSGGWIADGATQFYREFDDDVNPAIMRLQAALQEAAQVTREISRLLQAAEEEAAAQLGGDNNMLVMAQFGGGDQRANELIQRLRDRLNGQTPPTPLMAGMVGALPLAGGAAIADGPLPIGDLIALGILGTALIGGLIMMSNSTPNVDQGKVDGVLDESENATGNVTSGETLNDDEAIEALGEWVGDDYEEISPGVFRSRKPNADGSYNQGRIDNNSLEGNHPPNVPHVHLERVRPDPTRPGRWTTESNNHVPLGGGSP
jgi:WXG100 family type VII secretion target